MTSATPRTPSSKGADAAGGLSSMALDEKNSVTRVRSVDGASIIIDSGKSSQAVLLNRASGFHADATFVTASDSSSQESDDGFSDTDGISSSDDDSDDDGPIDTARVACSAVSEKGYLQINLDGKITETAQVLDKTLTSPASKSNATNRSRTALGRSAPPGGTKKSSNNNISNNTNATPEISRKFSSKRNSLDPASPPPPPPPPRRSSSRESTAPSLEPEETSRSPPPGPLPYPPNIPRHKRDQALLPSPLPRPSTTKVARRRWKKNSGGNIDNSGEKTGGALSPSSISKASSAAASILAANITPKISKSRKGEKNSANKDTGSGLSGSSNTTSTPRQSDSSGDVSSTLLMEQNRRKREEEAVSRLVDLAKRQQRFAAAWFAASQGGATVPPPPPPPPVNNSHGPRILPVITPTIEGATSKRVSGPIDADSGEVWEGDEGNLEPLGGKAVSISYPNDQPSKKIKKGVFASRILSTGRDTSSANDDESFVSSSSSKTPKIANTSPHRRDIGASEEEKGLKTPSQSPSRNVGADQPVLLADLSGGEGGHSGQQKDNAFWTRELRLGPCRLGAANCFVIIVLMTIIAGAAIIVLVGSFGDQVSPPVDSMTSDAAVRDNDKGTNVFDDSISVIPVTETPSSHPSTAEYWPASDSPTRFPTPLPSSTSPTESPSFFPTSSDKPSLQPTLHPTSSFREANYIKIGDKTMKGRDPDSHFGYSVAISADGKVMAVGSRYSDDNGPRSGEVRVFRLTSPKIKGGDGQAQLYAQSSWGQLGKAIKGRSEFDQFGFSVALSSDGLTLAASEPGFDSDAGERAGNVRIFRYDSRELDAFGTGGSWTKIGDLNGDDSNALFGVSVSLSDNGNRIAIGAPYHDVDGFDRNGESLKQAGRVACYDYDGKKWSSLGQTLDGTSPSDWFGWSVALSGDGRFVAAGSIRHVSGGYVRVYGLQGDSIWTQEGDDIYSPLSVDETRIDDRFGHSVSLSREGSRIVIGGPNSDPGGVYNAGMAAVYEWSPTDDTNSGQGAWIVLGRPMLGENEDSKLGWNVVISDDSDHVAIGVPGDSTKNPSAGSVELYKWNGSSQRWESAKPLYGKKDDEQFGFSLGISSDGSIAGVGAPSQNGDVAGYVTAYVSTD